MKGGLVDLLDPETFATFRSCHRTRIRWIVRDSGGAWDDDDFASEALLALHELQSVSGRKLDLLDRGDADRLLRFLHRIARRLGRGTRGLARPDQASDREEVPRTIGWDRIAAADGEHPLTLLEKREASQMAPASETFLEALGPYFTQAAGWAWLLRRFHHRMADVAAFLMISPSWGYARRRAARRATEMQRPLPPPADIGTDDQALRPWRKFKLPQREKVQITPCQASIDFWGKPPQPVSGQLWLL